MLLIFADSKQGVTHTASFPCIRPYCLDDHNRDIVALHYILGNLAYIQQNQIAC